MSDTESPAEAEDSTTETATLDAPRSPRRLQGPRMVAVMAGIGVLALLAGLLLGSFVVSPAQLAADAAPPEAGLITVPVERRILSNDVVIRGDAEYADSVEVTLETGDLGGPAIVTGQVPEPGDILAPGSLVIEVAGRPVIALSGDLPVFRTLRAGVAGPDVLQLKEALAELGIEVGNRDSDAYDAATAAAVRELYASVGYPAPSAGEGVDEGVRAAQDAVRGAEEFVTQARRELDAVLAGPSGAERIEQDNLVRQAERELQQARDDRDRFLVAAAEDALRLAQVRRDEALTPRDATPERNALASAEQQLGGAREALGLAQQEAMTPMPASELLYLANLPRRVDSVAVSRGTTLSGAALSVSGASLLITANAGESDAVLLEEGAAASIELDGEQIEATIVEIRSPSSGGSGDSGGRWRVLLEPDELSNEQLENLQGRNVRVDIEVGATSGEVLVVPLAALTAGADGSSRVEVATGERGSDGREQTRLVEVETGLAAAGYVEITPVDVLVEGDLVVVGR